jgi:hypothetical protein
MSSIVSISEASQRSISLININQLVMSRQGQTKKKAADHSGLCRETEMISLALCLQRL